MKILWESLHVLAQSISLVLTCDRIPVVADVDLGGVVDVDGVGRVLAVRLPALDGVAAHRLGHVAHAVQAGAEAERLERDLGGEEEKRRRRRASASVSVEKIER